MDKISPAFDSTLVEAKSWSDSDCNTSKEQNQDITACSPTSIPSNGQIVEVHNVVDIHSIPLDEDGAPNESDCSVAEVFTPRLPPKQVDANAESNIPPKLVELPQQTEESVLSGPSSSVNVEQEQDMQQLSSKASISSFPDQYIEEVKTSEPIQPAVDTTPSPMLFGSFVSPGKLDPNIVVSLEGADLWHQFYQAGTEMIITKSGRRMFPGIVTSIVGLEPESKYIVSLEVNPADNHRYKYINAKWVVVGKAESHCEDMLKYVHPDSPATGRHWTSSKVSFKKIKVTNNKNKTSKRGPQVALNSMHRYTPRVVISRCTSKKHSTVVYTLDLHECSFIAVTAYQNDQVTQLKIDHNPFAKAFRENPGEGEMYGYGGMMGSWPPISPLLSPYGNGFGDPQGMHQGMLSPGLVPPPGPSPLPHFGTAFGSWESPPYSPTSYRQFPTSGLSSPAALSDTHRQMVWNATKLAQDSPPISPLVNGFPAPSMNSGIYQFPHVASSASSTTQDGILKSPLMPGISISGVNSGRSGSFQPGFGGFQVSCSPVGYGPPNYSGATAAQGIIQAPNSNLKVPLAPNEQGSAFIIPKVEQGRSANSSPHLPMD